MKLGETTEAARRIGPIKAVLADGTPVTDFSAAGAVTVKVNDGVWSAAAGAVVVINDQLGNPSGYVYYQPAEGEPVRGFIAVKLAVVCVEATFREEVELAPQGIPVGTVDTSLLVLGPLEAKDADGNPVIGGVGIDVEVCINGAAWAPADSALTEISGGYYDQPILPASATARGWIAVKLSGACQEFVFRATIVDETAATGSAFAVAPTLPEVATPGIEQVSGDLKLTWSNESGDADLTVPAAAIDMDLETDKGIETAVLLSLFTDRRAANDDKPPSGDPRDRRGWWADEFAEKAGDLFGSRLWLLDRSTLSSETVLRANEYVREALQWMVEDRVVASIDAKCERQGNALYIAGALQRPGRDPISFRFAHTWDAMQEAA